MEAGALEKMIGKKVKWRREHQDIVGGKLVTKVDIIEIKLMVIKDGYAMVRRPRAMPFVVAVDTLALPE